MVHRLTDPFSSLQRLSQSVVQAGEMLGLYRAEVARLLGLQCEDVGALFEGRNLLVEGSDAWDRAEQFIRLYQALHERMEGDGVRMYHWLRAESGEFGSSPFLLMVDEGRLADVLAYLEQG
ncbi:hypothetical protein [Candidatus Reidiella endopervernicosa]|uniref:DUF2384 domain-containing protein n=1 Tax=Candidatus Reidiella endopervernicosa TaxID=2738883 RepID=A0A6N0HT25_9GAMM|nr:hypothetical protein [Candidatus Reidiella endopervernicosa]QKQ25367.1 hypothetical protein HUE57_02980 [Candidatus Reidiella endopervernicosa]